ncbi:hypothetical protein SAMN04488564_11048 [Lentzea waywayandensis]|uniref:PASTA domain-containing protein n=1 Tax=Lentzea waywayandensis TaxID=84724 RepID=A0A1I6F9B0_9PSEU|nr:hypothetical protein [Lentzea waywayandensis]SFR26556.1 hypothetical protein SAMN04488564_11048 [Lentzea waywayandensis]
MKLHLNKRNLLPATGAVFALSVVGACGSTAGVGSQATSTHVETRTSTATAATTAAPPVAAAPTTCTVPNVVGMVHQYAQDTMQAAGLYALQEKDATGQGRMLVLDRNWETTAQSVAAGQVVECTTVITLSAKKIGE